MFVINLNLLCFHFQNILHSLIYSALFFISINFHSDGLEVITAIIEEQSSYIVFHSTQY